MSLLLPISKPKTFLEIECLQSAGYLKLETWNPQIISRIFDIFSWVSCSLGLGQRVLFYHNNCPWFTEDWECSTNQHQQCLTIICSISKKKTGMNKNYAIFIFLWHTIYCSTNTELKTKFFIVTITLSPSQTDYVMH